MRQSDNVDIKKDIVNKFKQKFEDLDFKLNTSAWWLHWEWLPNIAGVDDFSNYVMFNEEVEEDFIKRILDLIEIFESKTNLMTDMNEYLNQKI